MFRMFFLLLLTVPTLEIALLLLSGKTFGVGWTIALIIITGVVGAWLARREGMETARLAQLQLQQGQAPQDVILDGLSILIGGIVLLTPGFITDFVGFLLLIPTSRNVLKGFLKKWLMRLAERGQWTFIIRK